MRSAETQAGMGAAQEVDRRFQHVARKSLLEDRPAAPAWASNLVDAMSSARRGETARLCAVAGGHSAKRTDWRRQQDSKRRFLSQNTSLFFGNVRPKVVDRSGLEPGLKVRISLAPAESQQRTGASTPVQGIRFTCRERYCRIPREIHRYRSAARHAWKGPGANLGWLWRHATP